MPIRWVLVRDPHDKYAPVALLSTAPDLCATQIVAYFVQRWQVEVTFQEARAHLGLETQRQWSDLAIARTTPILLGLFSWVTLVAHLFQRQHPFPLRSVAWYAKSQPTFADTIAWVRSTLWQPSTTFLISPAQPDIIKLPKPFFDRLVDTLCYAT